MKYLLLIYFEEHALSETEREACYVESTQLAREINSSLQYLAAHPLHPTSTGTSVRVRGRPRRVANSPAGPRGLGPGHALAHTTRQQGQAPPPDQA